MAASKTTTATAGDEIPSLSAKTAQVLSTMFRDAGLVGLSEIQMRKQENKWHVEFDLIQHTQIEHVNAVEIQKPATHQNLPVDYEQPTANWDQPVHNIEAHTMSDTTQSANVPFGPHDEMANEIHREELRNDKHTTEKRRDTNDKTKNVTFEEQLRADIKQNTLQENTQSVETTEQMALPDDNVDEVKCNVENTQTDKSAEPNDVEDLPFQRNGQRRSTDANVTDHENRKISMAIVELYNSEQPTSTTNTSELQLDISSRLDEQQRKAIICNVLGVETTAEISDPSKDEETAQIDENKQPSNIGSATTYQVGAHNGRNHRIDSGLSHGFKSDNDNEQNIRSNNTTNTSPSRPPMHTATPEVTDDVVAELPFTFSTDKRPANATTAKRFNFKESSSTPRRSRDTRMSLPSHSNPIAVSESRRSLRKSHRQYEPKKDDNKIKDQPSTSLVKKGRSLYYFKDFSDHFMDCRASEQRKKIQQDESELEAHHTRNINSREFLVEDTNATHTNVVEDNDCRYYVLKYCYGKPNSSQNGLLYIVNLYDKEAIQNHQRDGNENQIKDARKLGDVDKMNSNAIRWETIPAGHALDKYVMKDCTYVDASTQNSQKQCRSSQVNNDEFHDFTSMYSQPNVYRESWTTGNDTHQYELGDKTSGIPYIADGYDLNHEYPPNDATLLMNGVRLDDETAYSTYATSDVAHSVYGNGISLRHQPMTEHSQRTSDVERDFRQACTAYDSNVIMHSAQEDVDFVRNSNRQNEINAYGVQTLYSDRWCNPVHYTSEPDIPYGTSQLNRRCEILKPLKNVHNVMHHSRTINLNFPGRNDCGSKIEPTRKTSNIDACAHAMSTVGSTSNENQLYQRASHVLMQLDEAIKRIRLRKVVCTPSPFEVQCDSRPNASNQHKMRIYNRLSATEDCKKATNEDIMRKLNPKRLKDICGLDAGLNLLRDALNVSSNNASGTEYTCKLIHSDKNLCSNVPVHNCDDMPATSATVSILTPCLPVYCHSMNAMQHTPEKMQDQLCDIVPPSDELLRKHHNKAGDHDFARRINFELGGVCIGGDDPENRSDRLEAERLTTASTDTSPPALRSIDKVIERSMYNIHIARETSLTRDWYRRPPLLSGDTFEYVLRDNRAVMLHCGTFDVIYLLRNTDDNRLVSIKFRRASNSSFADIAAEADSLCFLQQYSVAGIPQFHGIVLIALDETRYVTYGLVSEFIGDPDTLRETSLRSLLAERTRCGYTTVHPQSKYSATKWDEMCTQLCLDIVATVNGIHEKCIISNSITADTILLKWNDSATTATVFLQHRNDYQVAYLAPEILQGRPATRASDLYSVARLITNITRTMRLQSLGHLVVNCLDFNPERRTNGTELFEQLVEFNNNSLVKNVPYSSQIVNFVEQTHLV